MKKPSQKMKSKRHLKKTNGDAVSKIQDDGVGGQTKSTGVSLSVSEKVPRFIQKTSKKAPDAGAGAIGRMTSKAGQFLKEAKVELKKVKWPTRKELLASTAVVIVLTLLVAFYLGLVDFGLIKIIRNVVG